MNLTYRCAYCEDEATAFIIVHREDEDEVLPLCPVHHYRSGVPANGHVWDQTAAAS